MTPAEKLTAAAEKVRTTAGRTFQDDWWWPADLANDFSRAEETDRAWIALARPAWAEPLAAWLESCAGGAKSMSHATDWGICDEPASTEQAVAMADAILGGGS